MLLKQACSPSIKQLESLNQSENYFVFSPTDTIQIPQQALASFDPALHLLYHLADNATAVGYSLLSNSTKHVLKVQCWKVKDQSLESCVSNSGSSQCEEYR
jgi:hypothetical protein